MGEGVFFLLPISTFLSSNYQFIRIMRLTLVGQNRIFVWGQNRIFGALEQNHSVCIVASFPFAKKVLAIGQLKSEWIYEVIVCSKMPTKFFPDFCPTKQTRIVAKKNLPYTQQKKCYDPCLFGRAEVWKNFGWLFGRNDGLINSF